MHPGVPPSHLRERSTGRTTRRVLLQAERHSESHAFRRSVFLRPQGKVHRLRSWRRAAGKARITLGAMPGRAPVILQSSLSSDSIGLRLICGRDKQQRAYREARTEHEHHRMELHRSPSLCELVLNDGHATRPELWLARFT